MTQTGWALAQLGFKLGAIISCLSPVLGLAVFWWFPFKPAVTFYVLISGLAYALLKWIKLARLSLELDEIVTKKLVKL